MEPGENENTLRSWDLKWRLTVPLVWMLLGFYRLLIRLIPFRTYASRIGVPNRESPFSSDERSRKRIQAVGALVRHVGARTPWESTCFVRALTAQRMLRWMSCGSTLYFGIRKTRAEGLQAHAWLRCGSNIVTGEEEMDEFTPVAHYGIMPVRGQEGGNTEA